MDALSQHLLDLLSEEHCGLVVKSQELIEQLPSEIDFKYWLISRSPEGLLEYNLDGDYYDCVSNPSSISTSESCMQYLLQLLGYIHECGMCFDEFFGNEIDYRRRDIEPGILFEYFLLLVQRYFELTRVDVQDLYDLSEDDGEEFEEKKEIAKVLLSLLNLASTDFGQNPHILPKLHALIDSVMHQFPDAMYLVVLADFSERSFESLFIVDNIFEGMQSICNEYSFRNKRIFQNLDAFKHFQVLSCFTPARLSRTFVCLLKNYCQPYYSETESKKAIANVCTFLMKKLPNEEAFEAINQILNEIEKQAEIVPLILEAILAIESEHLRGIVESPEFPIHPVESLKRLADNLDLLTRKYDFWRDRLKKLCPKKELIAALIAISEKSFVAGLIFERIFYKSVFDSKRKLEGVFDASVCGSIQKFMDYSKMLADYKEPPEKWILNEELQLLSKKFSDRIFESSGCGNKTTISAALGHLEIYKQKTNDSRQHEWRDGGVARNCWMSSNSSSSFPEHQRLTNELNKIGEIMRELGEHDPKRRLKDVRDENTLQIQGVKAQLKVFDDQKHRMRLDHTRLLQEAKKSILDRLFGASS